MAMGFHAKDYAFAPTAVSFKTDDARLQRMYDLGEDFLKNNEVTYNDKRLIKEGAMYSFIWLETQPMGGEMYAKRNVEVGLNNILCFMQYQRRDGRFPGMIAMDGKSDGRIAAHFDWMQGYYFARPAFKMWYLINKDRGYLEKLYNALKDFDSYLWAVRDSDGDGCLETWCVWDTGEDNCARFLHLGAKDGKFGGETAPVGKGRLPYESMEYMAYSYTNRDILSRISAILGNGQEEFWRSEAEKVRNKVQEYLWIPEKHACYDRDCDNEFIDSLNHINLRCMYHGLYTQQMADEFLYYHLMNPDEFWTTYPLTATAINDAFFLNNPDNNWSGPCQGLIYQRSIEALHNYGHYAEAMAVGRKVLELPCKTGVFYQQYDPFTGEPGKSLDGYGPMIFAFMEYLSLMQGVNISMDEAHWSNAVGCADSEYTQSMFGRDYTLVRKNGKMTARIDGKESFAASEGLRVVTDLEGNIQKVICIDEINEATVCAGDERFFGSVEPNGIYALRDDALVRIGGAAYYQPGVRPE